MDFGRKILAILFAFLVCSSSLSVNYCPVFVGSNNNIIANQTLQEVLESKSYNQYYEACTDRYSQVVAKQSIKVITSINIGFKLFNKPSFEQTQVTAQRCYFTFERIIHFRASIQNLIFPFNYFW